MVVISTPLGIVTSIPYIHATIKKYYALLNKFNPIIEDHWLTESDLIVTAVFVFIALKPTMMAKLLCELII